MEKGNYTSFEEMSQSTKMKYLRSKWSVWFHTLDANHDGKISSEDMDKSVEKFEKIRDQLRENAPKSQKLQDRLDDKKPEIEEFIKKWWNDYNFPKGPKKTMTEDEFVNSLAEAYQEDHAAFRKEMERCFEDIANFLTPDMTRNITENEFADGFKAFKFGQVDEEKIKEAYKLFKAAHEQLTVQLLVDAWVQFTADVDQSKQDIIMEIYGN